jgi:hypothetical protein
MTLRSTPMCPARRALRLRRLRLPGTLAGLATLIAGVSAAHAAHVAPGAHASRTISLNDSGRLHLTSHHGFTLNEQGSATGTISGTIYIHLNVVSTNHVTAEVNIYPHGGSITGKASASYRPSGALASFTGTMNIIRGTGRYSRARGTALSFTGTVQRSNDAVTVHVNGRISA